MKHWQAWLGDFRAGEFPLTVRLHTQFGLIVLALLLGRTVRDALFLSRAGVQGLPWLYVGTAVVATAATLIYTRTLRGRRPRVVAPLVQAVLAVGFLLISVLLPVGGTVVQVALYLWVEVLTILSVVQFWNITNESFNPRQAKRLYGFIAAGQALGNLACGVIASGAGRWYPVEFLLFVVIALVLGAGALYLLPVAPVAAPRGGTVSPRAAPTTEETAGFRRYVLTIIGIITLTYLATAWVDFQFKVIAGRTLDEAGMVRFFGQFYGAVGVVSFIIQFFLLRHVSSRIGLFGSLMLMPGAFILFGLGLPVWPMLALATALKFSENALRYAIYDPLLQTLFLPLPGSLRARVQSIASGVVKPLAIGMAGLALVPLRPDQPGGLPSEWLGLPIAAASAGVVWLLLRSRRDYVRVLVERANPKHEIARRESRVRIDEAVALDRLTAVVSAGGPTAVGWVLDRVEVSDGERRRSILAAAVARADLDMPLRARCVIEAGLKPSELPTETPPVLVDIASVRAGGGRTSNLSAHLDDTDVAVREAAVRALLEQRDPEALLAAREAVVLAMQGDASERMLAVRLADRLDRGERARVLRSALADSDPQLARRALQVLARHPDESFLADLVEAMALPALNSDAVRALAALGQSGLTALRLDRPWRRLAAAWPLWCREATDVDWANLLARLLVEEPDPRWWAPAARRLAEEPPVAGGPEVEDALKVATRWAEQAVAFASRPGPAAELARRAAAERRDAATVVALVLAFRLHPPAVERWTRMLVTDLGEQDALRASVAEVVDQELPRGIRERMLALIDAPPREQQPSPAGFLDFSPLIAMLAALAAGEDRPLEDAMQDLIDRVLFLSTVPLFRTLGGEELERIATVLEPRRHAAGETFIRSGDAGDSLYLITEGRVRVHVGDSTLAELPAGSVVGEMALLDDQPRSADVTALENVATLRLDRADFDAVLAAWPAIARGVMRVLTERLRKANRPAA